MSAQRKQKAFVLLKVEPGHERDVMNNLMELDEVREVHIIPGEWDIIAVVEAEKGIVVSSDERVYDIVLDKIEKTKHVQDTNTMVSHFSKSK
ncbi:MAG: Lrp/AsnC family transcriptional regulator [Thaumarchaeota archaeon]|nr:MAG: Lrp/AsnC family transcriptional regulator [Nitrososphaerota archaeon]TMQ01097.1 MAG: Lrp/AsnC family transcriptional regulator [Nitrososphaerota archaeon]